MPRLEGEPGQPLTQVWATLTETELQQLLDALLTRAEEIAAGQHDPGWHVHVGGPEGPELTLAVEQR
jgi:hypothetical protein